MDKKIKIPLAYIAGKYTGKTSWEVKQNIEAARKVSFEVMKLGAMPICPHTNTGFMEGWQSEEWWYEGTQEIERYCDCIVMCDGWTKSKGSIAEHKLALQLAIPVFYAYQKKSMKELADWIVEKQVAAADC